MKTREDFKEWSAKTGKRLSEMAYPNKRKIINKDGFALICYRCLCKGYEFGLADAKEILTKQKEN